MRLNCRYDDGATSNIVVGPDDSTLARHIADLLADDSALETITTKYVSGATVATVVWSRFEEPKPKPRPDPDLYSVRLTFTPMDGFTRDTWSCNECGSAVSERSLGNYTNRIRHYKWHRDMEDD